MECRTCYWTTGFLVRGNLKSTCLSRAGYLRTETQFDVGNAGSEKGNGVLLDRKESSETAIEALAREIGQARQGGSQTVPERPPVDESRAVGLVAGQARTLKAALERRKGTRVPPDAGILCWLVEICCVPDVHVRHRQ